MLAKALLILFSNRSKAILTEIKHWSLLFSFSTLIKTSWWKRLLCNWYYWCHLRYSSLRILGLWTTRGDCWDPHQVVEGGLVHKGTQGHSRCEGLFSDLCQFYDYHGSSAPQWNMSDGIINLLFFQRHVNLQKKKKTPHQGGDQMRKKKKKKLRTVEPYHKRKSRRGHNNKNNKSFIYSAGWISPQLVLTHVQHK